MLSTIASSSLNNVASRSPVFQSAHVRACDFCIHARVNDLFQIATPINLPTWDRVGECARRVSSARVYWGFAGADRYAAYKCEPMLPLRSKFCNLDVRNPVRNDFAASIPLTQLFGSTASVLNYNVLSRTIATLANRMVDIPFLGYFDDFGLITPMGASARELSAF